LDFFNKKLPEIKEMYSQETNVEALLEASNHLQSDSRKSVINYGISLGKKAKKIEDETIRLEKMLEYERELNKKGLTLVAGIDEAGRGPLAGPVVAAAVILPIGKKIEGVNDSKKLSEKMRNKLYDIIIKEAVDYGIGIVDSDIIDEINILNASKLAMINAVKNLKIPPDYLLIDAVKLDIEIPQMSIIKGDQKSLNIAAASIIAKVTRDNILAEYDKEYPEYGFNSHKGYGTSAHYDAINNSGIIEGFHRKTFLKKVLNPEDK
jgi:ribonuclease HII